MNQVERGELAGQIAAETQEVIGRATKNGMFVLPLHRPCRYSSRVTRDVAGSSPSTPCK